MSYEDFKLNPQEFEKMAREFSKNQNVSALEEKIIEDENLSEKQINLIDILIGYKILERLFLGSRERTRNQKIIGFVNDNLGEIEKMEQDLSKLGENVSSSDIDFEFPENDSGAIKMMQNVIASEILNLTNLIKFIEVPEHQNLIVSIIGKLAFFAKDILNLVE